MSVKAMTWVFDHSPYAGTQRLIHLAIADVVNDKHDNEFFLSREALAEKSACSLSTVAATLSLFVEDGTLEVLKPGGGRGKSTTYRFVFQNSPDSGGFIETVQSDDETVQSSPISAPYTVSSNSKNSIVQKPQTLGQVRKANPVSKSNPERKRIVEALILACAWDEDTMGTREHKRLNKVCSSILERNGTGVGVSHVAAAMRLKFDRPGNPVFMTPEAIDKHWVAFAPPRALSDEEQADRKFRDRVYAQWDRDGEWINAEGAVMLTPPEDCGILRLVDSTGYPVNAEGRRYHRSGASPRVYDS